MAEQVERVREVNTAPAAAGSTTQVVERNRTTTTGGAFAARIVWFIAGVIITLLAFRFVLILLGANRGSGFVDFIYSVSYPFAVPFFGIFNYDLKYGVSRLELSTLVAIAVYALVGYGLARLFTLRHPQA